MNLREAANDAGPMPPTPADWAAAAEENRRLGAEIERLKEFHVEDMRVTNESAHFHILECVKLRADKERLDWLEAQTDGSLWIARQSSTGRGFRLHNTGGPAAQGIERPTAREAIDAARERMK